MVRFFWNKHKFIRVVKYNGDKSCVVTYIKSSDFKPSYLVNPDHVFLFKGYRTIMITDKSTETINPLDFTSKYSKESFQTAIESKIIKDTFATITKSGLDLTTILLIVLIIIGLAGLYLSMKGSGMI